MNIKSICKMKGIDFKELSKLTGISLCTLYCLERGTRNPSIKTLKKLREALNVSVDSLIN